MKTIRPAKRDFDGERFIENGVYISYILMVNINRINITILLINKIKIR
ncbi:MAG: hypothetical protein ACJA08_001276 [Cyclobacteriaceae bacterium]